MKHRCRAAVAVCWTVLAAGHLAAQTVSVDFRSPIITNHHGYGVLFDADILLCANKIRYNSVDQWETLKTFFREVQPKQVQMQVPIIMWEAYKGQRTFDSDWIRALYTVMDFFRDEGFDVELCAQIGESMPSWCSFGNLANTEEEGEFIAALPDYAESFAEFMKHLSWERGYWNIKDIFFYREPENNHSKLSTIDLTYRLVREAMNRKGLSAIKFSGYDSVQLNRQMAWRDSLRNAMGPMDDIMDRITFNMYATFLPGGSSMNTTLYVNDDLYNLCREIVLESYALDRDGKREPVSIAEGECQTNDPPHWEGAYFIDSMRAGISGVTCWWFMDRFFIWSAEVQQDGSVDSNSAGQYVRSGRYWAYALNCAHGYYSGSVFPTALSGTGGNMKAICLKDNDSDSYTLFVHSRNSSAMNTTFNLPGLGNRTWQKYVHPTLTPVGTVTMTNGTMTDSVAGSNYTIYKSTGPKESVRPTPPGNLTATALNPRTVRLSWTAGTDNVRVRRYNIYKNGSATPTISVQTLGWEDTKAQPGQQATYVVRTVDGAGNESDPATVTVTPPMPASAAPTAPTNVKLVDTLADIELSWTPSTDDQGVVKYRVYHTLSGQPGTRVAEVYGNPPRAYYVCDYGYMEGHFEGVTHSIAVSAVDAEGNESPRTSTITFTRPYGKAFDMDDYYACYGDGIADWSFERRTRNGIAVKMLNQPMFTYSVGFNANQIKQVYIKLRNTSTHNQLRVSWLKTKTYPNTYAGSRSIPITTNDTTFKEYVIDLTGDATFNGTVYHFLFQFQGGSGTSVLIDHIRIGTFPLPKIVPTSSNPAVGVPVTFNTTGSQPSPGGAITSWEWDFGDGTTGTGPSVTHTYTQPGYYTVTLKASEANPLVYNVETYTISVGNPTPLKPQPVNTIGMTQTRVDVYWDPNPETDIARYRVYRSLSPSFTPGPATFIGETTRTWYADKTLAANTKYYYAVSAVDTAGQEGPFSEIVMGQTRVNPNLLSNSGFETGTKAGWSDASNGGTIVTTGQVYDGTYTFRWNSAAQSWTLDRTDLILTPGKRYRFVAAVYMETAVGDYKLITRACHPNWTPVYGSGGPYRQLGKWQYVNFEFVPTDNCIIQMISWYGGTYTFYMDDCFLDEVSTTTVPSSTAAPDQLRVNGQAAPILSSPSAVMSWRFNDPDPGDTQSSYQIIAATTVAAINANQGSAWDSGRVASSQQSAPYGGVLAPGVTYYWKVRTWDNGGSVSSYSVAATFYTAMNTPPAAPDNLRCQGQENPTDVSVSNPVLSWTFNDPGDAQRAYQILVSSIAADLASDNGRTWNSGVTQSATSSASYAGAPLQPGVTYYWKVRTWDRWNVPGAYSAVAQWTMIQAVNNPPNPPNNLRCNGLVNPSSVTGTAPVLSWTFSDPDAGQQQSAWQILVSTAPANLAADIGDAWDSGKVNSAASSAAYAGAPLLPGVTYYWKVRVWDNDPVLSLMSAYASPASWTMQPAQPLPAVKLAISMAGNTVVAHTGLLPISIQAWTASNTVAGTFNGISTVTFRAGSLVLRRDQVQLANGLYTIPFSFSTATTLTVTAEAAGLSSTQAVVHVLVDRLEDTWAVSAHDNGATRARFLSYTYPEGIPCMFLGTPVADGDIALPAGVRLVPGSGRDMRTADPATGQPRTTAGRELHIFLAHPDADGDGMVDGMTDAPVSRLGLYVYSDDAAAWVPAQGYEPVPAERTVRGVIQRPQRCCLVIVPPAAPPVAPDPITTVPGEVKIVGGSRGYIDATAVPEVRIAFNPTTTGEISVAVYTLRGILVWERKVTGTASVQGDLRWRCDTSDGAPVAAGIYLVRIKGGGLDLVRRIAVVR